MTTTLSPLDELVRTKRIPGVRIVAVISAMLVTAFLVWAWTAKLDEVSSMPGTIAPAGQVKVIQHLEGGIINKLAVREGDIVSEGDLLLQLELGVGQKDPQQILIQQDGLMLTRARLLAEGNGIELVFPENEAVRLPGVVNAERQTHRNRMAEAENQRRILEEKVNQRKSDLAGLKTRRAEVGRSLGLARQQLRISSDLLKDGLTSKLDHLTARRDVQNLVAEVKTLEGAILSTAAGLEEALRTVDQVDSTFRREALEDLTQVEVSLARLKQDMISASGQRRRTEIRAPIDGVVKDLRYNTLGGVVSPASPIMEIVPIRDKLVVEGRLSPAERGYVSVGMEATIKVTAYEFIRYGSVAGTVTQVGADSRQDDNGLSYFPVVIETRNAYVGENKNLTLTAGMEAFVDIHTGERTVLTYLLTPLLRLQAEAFRDR